MILKNWKKCPLWYKGGAILTMVYLFSFFMLLFFRDTKLGFILASYIIMLVYLISLLLNPIITCNINECPINNSSIIFAIAFVINFIIGALIGFVLGKMKGEKNVKDKKIQKVL